MGKEGVEPSQPYGQRILSPSCMPFHHLPHEAEVLSIDSLSPKLKFKVYKFKAWTGREPVNSGFVLRLLSHFILSSLRIFIKATIGIEPMYSGFADHCLTPWLRRHKMMLAVVRQIKFFMYFDLICSPLVLSKVKKLIFEGIVGIGQRA